jgi:hypothetical protein
MKGSILSDQRLAACSLAAQGMYARVRDLASLMEKPGRLDISAETICVRVAVSPAEGVPLLAELEAHGQLHREDQVLVVEAPEFTARAVASRSNGKLGGRPQKPRKPRSEPRTEPSRFSRFSGSDLTRWWDTEYQRTRGVAFDWVRSARRDGSLGGCPDAIVLANLAKQFDPEDIKRRITRYLESPSLFDAQTASPRMFQRAYATLAVEVRPLPKTQETPQTLALAEALKRC